MLPSNISEKAIKYTEEKAIQRRGRNLKTSSTVAWSYPVVTLSNIKRQHGKLKTHLHICYLIKKRWQNIFTHNRRTDLC